MKRFLTALMVVVALGAAPGASAVTLHDGDGIHVASLQALDSRLLAASVTTPALPGVANVRILLPSGYAAHPRRRYPVLYLLHGTSGGAADWTTKGAAEQTTAGLPLIVVMPDIALNDNGGGWCTNWYNGGAFGQPEWETFHIDQLIPWVDRNLRTVAARSGRAIAGLSQGGFCSMSYAARHPDLFMTALSYSGAPDIAYDAEAQALVTPVINLTETVLDGVPANSMFGPRTTEEINWAAHDPTTLAGNLRGMNLFMYTGNGQNGPFDTVPNPGASAIEAGVEQLTRLFHQQLDSLGIPSLYDDYGPGTHSWPYWARDLQQSIGPIVSDFAHPSPPPAQVTYTSADPQYSVFGWSVSMHRAVEELSTLANADREGFTVEGSGSATVTTPALYRPHRRYRVVVGPSNEIVRAGPDGRLVIEVPLGPSNVVQEFPGDGPPIGTTVYTTRVSVR
jgi:S-formylglutathione hydrolase FrmB